MAGPTTRVRGFGPRLVCVVLAGAVLRLLYDVVVLHRLRLGIDATWYYLEGGVIRHEHAFADPAVFATERAATAAWPPLYPAFLALVQSVAGDSIRAAQLAGVATGSVTVALTGLIGRRIAGTRHRTRGCRARRDQPDPDRGGRFADGRDGLRPACARDDAAGVARGSGRQRVAVGRGRRAGGIGRIDARRRVAARAVRDRTGCLERSSARLARGCRRASSSRARRRPSSSPRVGRARNARRVDAPTIATVSSSTAIAGANCGPTYAGDDLGSWEFACIRDDLRVMTDRARLDVDDPSRRAELRRRPRVELPVVGAARVSRDCGACGIPSTKSVGESLETRNRTWQYLVIGTGLVTLTVGIVGFVTLRRAKRAIGGLVGLVLMVTTVALTTYGNTRFRTTAEPALLIGVPRSRPVSFIAAGATRRRGRIRPSCDTAVSTSGNAYPT